MKLTGKALYDMVIEAEMGAIGTRLVRPWEKISPITRGTYDVIVKKLNEAYIEPLHSLARDWRQHARTSGVEEVEDDEAFEANFDAYMAWANRGSELRLRTSTLC